MDADIAIISRKIDSCQKTAAEVEALGRKAFPYACNLGQWDALYRMVDAVYDRFAKIDVLINNAGLSPIAPSLLETSEALFDKVIGVKKGDQDKVKEDLCQISHRKNRQAANQDSLFCQKYRKTWNNLELSHI